MFPTMEARWFCQGAIPPHVLTWFQRGGEKPDAPLCRVDHYLRLPDRDSLGLKLREGGIEVKQRQAVHGAVPLHERVVGRVEQWRKWRFALGETHDEVESLLVPAGSWIGVHKARRLRRYRLAKRGLIAAVPLDDYPDQGCSWELTELRVGPVTWWSLGFEASGEESNLRKSLFAVAGHILAACEPPVLEAQDSYGYPRWLQWILRQEGA